MNATIPHVQPGELLAGKYRVDRVLGEGGMGVVLAAKNEMLNQAVAIKVLRPGALENTEALARFKREAQIAASLRSEHVARVLDVGTLGDERPYMVMEMLTGQDLGDLIDKGPRLSIQQAVDYVLQACEAIAEAHAAGVVHRDLKPKNLFLTHAVHGKPLVKVLDFGISKLEVMQSQSDMQLTKTSEIIGSPSYMSPEQLRSARNVDPRTDIWALGVILYELLTGRLPFYAHTVTELVLVVVTEQEPPAKALRPDVPDQLSWVIGKCLAKRPEDRFQSVAELARALEPFAHSGLHVSAADRVVAVAASSGRALPPSNSGQLPPGGSSSSRVNVHGGTSVAWGETQMDPPRTTQSGRKSSVLVAAICVGLVAALGAGGTAVWFVRRAQATTAQNPPAASENIPLPPGRKDLPPLPASTPAASVSPPPAANDSAIPSTLPDVRKPPEKPATTGKPTAPKPPPPAPPTNTSDLSNIGRR
jgi:eukaryotic-like serine/threonine-protein kinase